MKRVGGAIAWGLSRAIKSFGNLLSALARCFVKVKRGRVVCWAYNYKQYGCNPRYLTEYLLEHHPDMEIVWVFRKGVDISAVDKRVKCVRFRTWEYLKVMASAEFLVTNSRTDPWHIYWHSAPSRSISCCGMAVLPSSVLSAMWRIDSALAMCRRPTATPRSVTL